MSIPVLLDVTGWPTLVVGGGRIGVRRAERLADAGADVTVLSANPTVEVPASIRHEAVNWSEGWTAINTDPLSQWRIVVAATDDVTTNTQITRWAHSIRAVTFRVDRDRSGPADQTSPAARPTAVDHSAANAALGMTHRDGPMTAAVFSNGAAPGLSRWLLGSLIENWPQGIGTLASCAEEAAAVAATKNPSARTHLSLADWQSLDVGGMLDAVRESHLDLVKERLAACLSS